MYLVNNVVVPTQMVDINANGTNIPLSLFNIAVSYFRSEPSPSKPFSPTGTFLLNKLLMTELITKSNSTASVISRSQECLLNLENSPLSTEDQNQVPKPVQPQEHPPPQLANQPPPPPPLVAPYFKRVVDFRWKLNTYWICCCYNCCQGGASATGSGSTSTATGKSSGHATYGSRGFAIAIGMIGVGFAAMFVTA